MLLVSETLEMGANLSQIVSLLIVIYAMMN